MATLLNHNPTLVIFVIRSDSHYECPAPSEQGEQCLFSSGIIMVGVIVGSKKTGINPDNVATPIAASFGDLITLAILAWISQGLYNCLGEKDVCEKSFVPSIFRHHMHI